MNAVHCWCARYLDAVKADLPFWINKACHALKVIKANTGQLPQLLITQSNWNGIAKIPWTQKAAMRLIMMHSHNTKARPFFAKASCHTWSSLKLIVFKANWRQHHCHYWYCKVSEWHVQSQQLIQTPWQPNWCSHTNKDGNHTCHSFLPQLINSTTGWWRVSAKMLGSVRTTRILICQAGTERHIPDSAWTRLCTSIPKSWMLLSYELTSSLSRAAPLSSSADSFCLVSSSWCRRVCKRSESDSMLASSSYRQPSTASVKTT